MAATITPQHCAYPGCDQLPAARGSDRGAKPKYCDDPDHNPLSAHRERRRREAGAGGQRAEETGGQPVTFGLTRASELVRALDKIISQHADTLARAIAELRAVGDIESAEAKVHAARTRADQRVATVEARLAEEVQRRGDAEAAAADEAARIRADHRQALDQLTAATSARITALEETRDALKTRAERAEADLDAARLDNRRLAEKLAEATSDAKSDPAANDATAPLPRTPSRARKAPVSRNLRYKA